MTVYADLSTNITQRLVASGTPYLPANIWLNVNYPAVSSSSCSSQAKFKFVLSRINAAGSTTPADVKTCGMTRLPTETSVVNTPGYYASISVGEAASKADANASTQAVVFGKLKQILSCLPSCSVHHGSVDGLLISILKKSKRPAENQVHTLK